MNIYIFDLHEIYLNRFVFICISLVYIVPIHISLMKTNTFLYIFLFSIVFRNKIARYSIIYKFIPIKYDNRQRKLYITIYIENPTIHLLYTYLLWVCWYRAWLVEIIIGMANFIVIAIDLMHFEMKDKISYYTSVMWLYKEYM